MAFTIVHELTRNLNKFNLTMGYPKHYVIRYTNNNVVGFLLVGYESVHTYLSEARAHYFPSVAYFAQPYTLTLKMHELTGVVATCRG